MCEKIEEYILGKKPERIVIFCLPLAENSIELVCACIDYVRTHPRLEIAAIINTATHKFYPEPVQSILLGVSHKIKTLLNSRYKEIRRPLPLKLYRSARSAGIPVIVPPELNINGAEFLEMLRQLKPTVGLSLICLQKFKPELLDVFEVAVNYHNGYLPEYRGLHTTSWSLYNREPESGYSFHRMDKDIDTGSVLVRGGVPVTAADDVAVIEMRKTELAIDRLPEVFDLIEKREGGSIQEEGKASYYSRKSLRKIRRIEDPGSLTFEELRHRLRCFEILILRIENSRWAVTRLEEMKERPPGASRPGFKTKDGIYVEATRFLDMPGIIYRLLGKPGI